MIGLKEANMLFTNAAQNRKSIAVLCTLLFLASLIITPQANAVELCQGNYQTEKQAIDQLAKFAATYSNCDQWQARADNIRQAILRGTDLDPLPAKTPLNPIIRNKRKFDVYSVANAAFEALPG